MDDPSRAAPQAAPDSLPAPTGAEVSLAMDGPVEPPIATGGIHAAWFSRMRLGLVVGLAVVTGLAQAFLQLDLPLLELAVVLTLMMVSNLTFMAWARKNTVSQRLLLLVMSVDVVALTLIFYLTGGPANPFNSLYVVYVAFGAVMLSSRASWALSAAAFGGFGLLFFWSRPLQLTGHAGHDHGHAWHLQGMWVSFGLAAVLIVYFVHRLTRAVAARDAEVARLEAAQERADRLAALATLAAGAAHELATPLSTIAVVAKELERGLAKDPTHADAAEDARLVRAQVDRCRDILDQMSADAGNAVGEALVEVDAAAFAEKVLSNLRGDPARVRVEAPEGLSLGRVPLQAVARGVRGLVANGLHASEPDGAVRLRIAVEGDGLVITVEDQGTGMSADTLEHLGEPFRTTKAPGEGMGLGVFLMRTVAERLGGRLDYVSRPDQGTTARLTLPLVR